MHACMHAFDVHSMVVTLGDMCACIVLTYKEIIYHMETSQMLAVMLTHCRTKICQTLAVLMPFCNT